MQVVYPIIKFFWQNRKTTDNEVWNGDSTSAEVTNCQTEKHVVRRSAAKATSIK